MEQNMPSRNGNICYCRRCNGVIHRINQGDTLYSLSRRYGVGVGEIISANPFINIYNLRIGQDICIPVRNRNMSNAVGTMEQEYFSPEEMTTEDIDDSMNDRMMEYHDNEKYENNMEYQDTMTSSVSDGMSADMEVKDADDFFDEIWDDDDLDDRFDSTVMMLTGEEKLGDVLEKYDIDIEDFVECIRRNR